MNCYLLLLRLRLKTIQLLYFNLKFSEDHYQNSQPHQADSKRSLCPFAFSFPVLTISPPLPFSNETFLMTLGPNHDQFHLHYYVS